MQTQSEAEKRLEELNRREPHMAAFRWVGKTPACKVWAVLQQLPPDIGPMVLSS